MTTKNNKDYDSLTLFVKKPKSEMIINSYQNFGWSLTSQSENTQYEDIDDLSFCRPHKIKNKDELQLLQVYLEDKLNNMGKLEKHKNAKTTAFGLFFGVIGLLLVVFGSLFGLKLLLGINLLTSLLMTITGIIFLIITIIVIPKLHKKEIERFDLFYSFLEKEINEICQKAASLLRGNNDD